MKLSVMSYTLAKMYVGKPFDLVAMCRLAQELGTDGVDMVTLYGYPAAEVRKILDDHGIKTVCHTFGPGLNTADPAARRAALDIVRRGLDDARALGTDKIMVVTPGKADMSRDESRQNYIAGLVEAAKLAERAGITLTIENFPGENSPFVTADDFFLALREVPSLRLTYDNGNAFGGEDPAQSFARCAKYAVHAHFKDWDELPAGQGRRMLNGKWYTPALIGEGVLDHKACLAAMKRAGYSGYINIEYEATKYPADQATRRAAAYLKGLMAELDRSA